MLGIQIKFWVFFGSSIRFRVNFVVFWYSNIFRYLFGFSGTLNFFWVLNTQTHYLSENYIYLNYGTRIVIVMKWTYLNMNQKKFKYLVRSKSLEPERLGIEKKQYVLDSKTRMHMPTLSYYILCIFYKSCIYWVDEN